MVPAFGFVTGLCRVRRGAARCRPARLRPLRPALAALAPFFVKKARTVGARFCESPMG